MIRRAWIKLYVDQVLRGTCFTELDEAERFIWFGFLLLAGDSAYPGIICATEQMGYSNEQIADLLKTSPELIKKATKKMIKYGKITVDDNGKIVICKWKIYQSEYQRQRYYRNKKQDELLNVVTTQGAESSPSISISTSISYFSNIWKEYPNKIGKTKAQEKFGKSVKSEEDYKKIQEALKRYKHHLSLNDWKKPQDGSTWFNNWIDWVDYVEPEKEVCGTCKGRGFYSNVRGYEVFCACTSGQRKKESGYRLNN